jgi:hypothetical protein
LDQNGTPPPYAWYVGVRVGGELGSALISSSLAQQLASAIESQDLGLAARLRSTAGEACEHLGPRNDLGDEREMVRDTPEDAAFAYHLLGLDPPTPGSTHL